MPDAVPEQAIPLPPAGAITGAVLIPVKAFDQAKGRLRSALDPQTRATLARTMATNLVQVQHGVTVAVCCDDPGVAEWATSVGAATIWCPGTGLNGAVQHGLRQVRDAGYRSLAVAHSDLPLATSLDHLQDWPGVTLVPDRHRSGSNVICLSTAIDFQFSYGSGSLRRHVIEAVRHRRGLRIVHDRNLGWDVDRPDDLDLPRSSVISEVVRPAATTARSADETP